MKISRQGERRARFAAASNDMPRLETWTGTSDGLTVRSVRLGEE